MVLPYHWYDKYVIRTCMGCCDGQHCYCCMVQGLLLCMLLTACCTSARANVEMIIVKHRLCRGHNVVRSKGASTCQVAHACHDGISNTVLRARGGPGWFCHTRACVEFVWANRWQAALSEPQGPVGPTETSSVPMDILVLVVLWARALQLAARLSALL